MGEDRIVRLERRLARERAARQQAEEIAEKGLRDLYRANMNLDQMVTERTHELHSARVELERSAKRREAFLASLSRQVRTPLNGVVGMLDLLEGHVQDDQGRSYLTSAKGSADDLLRLFSRLILFVDLDQGARVEPAEIELATVLSHITDEWTRDAMASGQLLFVENSAPIDVALFTIGEHLELLLGELIHNAVSHSGPGSLRLDARLDDDHVVFEVSDPGGTGHPNDTGNGEGMGFALVERLAATIDASVDLPEAFDGPAVVRVAVPTKLG
ncbi:MAG: HAMP domain-containing histidine kinase [Acidimicrobiia bacterium]|nr:HAMP domain-containing histidine kinase [Acidimicrobiia bacterium]